MKNDYNTVLENKIIEKSSLSRVVAQHHFFNKKIVFTNGCFDLLHLGHLDYLAKARNLGDLLILGLNSDASIKKLKGNNRPINSIETRQKILASLIFVDFVIVFEEETPIELIKKINPNVLVKGGDYELNQIVGHEWVQNQGGIVTTIPFLEGFSSTSIIEKIQNL